LPLCSGDYAEISRAVCNEAVANLPWRRPRSWIAKCISDTCGQLGCVLLLFFSSSKSLSALVANYAILGIWLCSIGTDAVAPESGEPDLPTPLSIEWRATALC